jgi:hypothetical protein
MALVPSTRTWVAGEVVTDAYMNNTIRDPLNFLLARPIFKGYQTVAQSIPNNTFTAVTLDSEAVDSAGGHSTVTNTSRYTAVYAGWYEKGGGATFASNAATRRLARPQVNSTAVVGSMSGIVGIANIVGFAYRADRIFLNVADILEDALFQDTGGALNTFVSPTEYGPSMTLTWASN